MNPDKYTIAEHHYQTDDKLHRLYIQEWGNPKGKPILFMHGGPGSGCNDKHKLIFDRSKHRVLFADQRGAGHSTPSGSLEHNTTPHLIQDIELIRTKLGIDKWTLYGNSWGSTLSLCYAIAHPERVNNLVIAGVWLATTEENDWLHNGGWRYNFPEVWQNLLDQTPNQFHDKPGDYHHSMLVSKDPEAQKKSMFAIASTQYMLISLDEQKLPSQYETFNTEDFIIETTYKNNSCYIHENYILDNAHKLTMPIYIVQGRYDMVCPPLAAHKLHAALPNSQITMALSGHTLSRGNTDIIAQTLALL